MLFLKEDKISEFGNPSIENILPSNSWNSTFILRHKAEYKCVYMYMFTNALLSLSQVDADL